MILRNLDLADVDKIEMINAECFIRYAWRIEDSLRKLVEINWTDHELPNGLIWHKKRFEKTINQGGAAFGCFIEDIMIGYACVNRKYSEINSSMCF